jgi:PAS domain S-box-containing protein
LIDLVVPGSGHAPHPPMPEKSTMNGTAIENVALDLEDLYENAPCGYHSIGSDGTILRVNRTELAWLGFEREELVGKRKLRDLVTARTRDVYLQAIQALIAGASFMEIEIELVRKDASQFDAFLRIGAIRDSRGGFAHTRATVIDITARKRAEAERRLHAEELQAISHRVVQIQETERSSLSAELHDRLGQDLAAINLNLHIIKEQLSSGSRSKIGLRLDDSIALVERTVEVVRDVAGALRPLVLDDYGLAASLQSYGDQIAARTGIQVVVTETSPIPRLEQDTEMALFRVSQEALTNVLRYAQASAVQDTLAAEGDSVALAIADDGCGFDAAAAMDHRTRGLGLLIMHERLRAVEGSLQILSQPGSGTTVIATVKRAR